mmetsp:Transcript_82643/g.210230  ORF Transcript_82643/g.210230 Transcript_82643/m.210230 type:complete len:213 (+) Transcript_82643:131-769(+)
MENHKPSIPMSEEWEAELIYQEQGCSISTCARHNGCPITGISRHCLCLRSLKKAQRALAGSSATSGGLARDEMPALLSCLLQNSLPEVTRSEQNLPFASSRYGQQPARGCARLTARAFSAFDETAAHSARTAASRTWRSGRLASARARSLEMLPLNPEASRLVEAGTPTSKSFLFVQLGGCNFPSAVAYPASRAAALRSCSINCLQPCAADS